jgi:hypothetical protein
MDPQPAGCLGFVFRLLGLGGARTAPATALPKVQINKYFVSNAEADFFRVLTRVVGGRAHVLAQVSLRQLVWFPGTNQSNAGRGTWQNKVAAKSVDFVLCDPSTLRPKVVIELDEPTHARPARQTRDDDVEAILRAAGLPVVRVLTSRGYETRELEAALQPYLQRA